MQELARIRGEYAKVCKSTRRIHSEYANTQIRKYANTQDYARVLKSSQEYASRCAQVRKTKSSRMVRIRDTWFSAVYLCNDPSTSPMGNGVRGMAHREWCAGMVHRERCAGNGAQGMGGGNDDGKGEVIWKRYRMVIGAHGACLWKRSGSVHVLTGVTKCR